MSISLLGKQCVCRENHPNPNPNSILALSFCHVYTSPNPKPSRRQLHRPHAQNTEHQKASGCNAQLTSTHNISGPFSQTNYVSLAILPQPLSAHAFVHRRRPRSVRGFRSHGFGSDRTILGLDGDGGRPRATAEGAHGRSQGEVRGRRGMRPNEGPCRPGRSTVWSSTLAAPTVRRALLSWREDGNGAPAAVQTWTPLPTSTRRRLKNTWKQRKT